MSAKVVFEQLGNQIKDQIKEQLGNSFKVREQMNIKKIEEIMSGAKDSLKLVEAFAGQLLSKDQANKRFVEILSQLGLATKKDIEELKSKIKKLESELKQKSSAPSSPAGSSSKGSSTSSSKPKSGPKSSGKSTSSAPAKKSAGVVSAKPSAVN